MEGVTARCIGGWVDLWVSRRMGGHILNDASSTVINMLCIFDGQHVS